MTGNITRKETRSQQVGKAAKVRIGVPTSNTYRGQQVSKMGRNKRNQPYKHMGNGQLTLSLGVRETSQGWGAQSKPDSAARGGWGHPAEVVTHLPSSCGLSVAKMAYCKRSWKYRF